ncbi:hypothetical protein [Prosthecobacter dejongeii]|uniref:Uncharacterized protein n=1 Tax=Prosthecobacter dejongeii TaxID=48465 RepID=A0A7W7YHD2_9BACT|nr:hypothetical protein [Prosthecobacter dejongeii]MBB5036159.1 hypothetical protein [Prosthecobacter dejongeii]
MVELDRISSTTERWFVEEPFQDISACLVLEETNGQTVWWGCAALVPSDAPYNTCEVRPDLCSALGMVTDSLVCAVQDLAFSELCQLSDRSWRDPLFSAGPGSLSEVLDNAIVGQEILVCDGNIKAQDLMAWIQKQQEAHWWHPLVLTKCPLSFYEEDRWKLVQRWEEWKRNGTPIKAQCKEYNLEFSDDKTLAAFRIHLKYQGLPSSDKALGKKKRSRWRKSGDQKKSHIQEDRNCQ